MALNKLFFSVEYFFFLFIHETFVVGTCWTRLIEALPVSTHNKCFIQEKEEKKSRSNVDMLVICGFTIITLVEGDKIDKESKNNGHLIILF